MCRSYSRKPTEPPVRFRSLNFAFVESKIQAYQPKKSAAPKTQVPTSVLLCTSAAAAAAPPLASPASVWSQEYTHPQPGITERERRKRKEEDDDEEGTEKKGTTFTWREKRRHL